MLSFDEQANLAVYYSFVKLKEQEIKNIVWMAELIARNTDKQNPQWKTIINPFQSNL